MSRGFYKFAIKSHAKSPHQSPEEEFKVETIYVEYVVHDLNLELFIASVNLNKRL